MEAVPQQKPGQYAEPRSRSGQEAHDVGGCKGEDFKGDEGAVGKIQSREEQERKDIPEHRRRRRRISYASPPSSPLPLLIGVPLCRHSTAFIA